MTATTTNHVIEMEVSPADALHTRAYAWFCSCGERSEWEYTDDQDGLAAYEDARADAREHQDMCPGQNPITACTSCGRTVEQVTPSASCRLGVLGRHSWFTGSRQEWFDR